MSAPDNIGQRIENALKELTACKASLEEASKEYERARSEETAWLNRVNGAQKKLDELVASLKAEAPRDSDWAMARQKRVEVGP